MDTIKIGIVGCGVISDIYLQNIAKFDVMEAVACADLIPEKAEEKAKAYSIPKSCSVKEIMDDPEIDIVLNLTIPASHAEISLAALNAGKNVYSEKPLAVELEDGKKIVDLAKEKGLLVGCAPDTFLGGRLQTCRKLIDEGWIGKPIGATAFMVCHGHECWHPGPEFYYKVGAGPMFDMGPYYMTALVTLLGPVKKRVSGSAQKSFSTRRITSEPLNGKIIDVEVRTHISGTLEFESGAIVTVLTSFDVWDSHLPNFEIFGSEGTLSIVDDDPLAGPNLFEGKILLRRKDDSDWNDFPNMIPRKAATEWDEIPAAFGYNENSRGVGLADMSYALINKRPNRVNGDTAYHVLEIMHGIHIAANQGKYYEMKSSCKRPEPFEMGMPEYVITD